MGGLSQTRYSPESSSSTPARRGSRCLANAALSWSGPSVGLVFVDVARLYGKIVGPCGPDQLVQYFEVSCVERRFRRITHLAPDASPNPDRARVVNECD